MGNRIYCSLIAGFKIGSPVFPLAPCILLHETTPFGQRGGKDEFRIFLHDDQTSFFSIERKLPEIICIVEISQRGNLYFYCLRWCAFLLPDRKLFFRANQKDEECPFSFADDILKANHPQQSAGEDTSNPSKSAYPRTLSGAFLPQAYAHMTLPGMFR